MNWIQHRREHLESNGLPKDVGPKDYIEFWFWNGDEMRLTVQRADSVRWARIYYYKVNDLT
jgi:hypothetical protein